MPAEAGVALASMCCAAPSFLHGAFIAPADTIISR